MRIIPGLLRDDTAMTVASGQRGCGMHRSEIQSLFGGWERDNFLCRNKWAMPVRHYINVSILYKILSSYKYTYLNICIII